MTSDIDRAALLPALVQLVTAAKYMRNRVVETRGVKCMDDLDAALDLADRALAEQTSPAPVPGVGGVVAYIVPQYRVTADGSYEDGPEQLEFASDVGEHVRPYFTPLYLHPSPVEAAAERDTELIERVAKAIYQQWENANGYVPWVEKGNSHFQNDARRIARAAIDAQNKDGGK